MALPSRLTRPKILRSMTIGVPVFALAVSLGAFLAPAAPISGTALASALSHGDVQEAEALLTAEHATPDMPHASLSPPAQAVLNTLSTYLSTACRASRSVCDHDSRVHPASVADVKAARREAIVAVDDLMTHRAAPKDQMEMGLLRKVRAILTSSSGRLPDPSSFNNLISNIVELVACEAVRDMQAEQEAQAAHAVPL